MNNGESDSNQKSTWLPEWFHDGLTGAAADALKTILLPIFLVLIISGIGFLLYLNSVYINISIVFPAYQVGIAFGIATIIVFLNQKFIRRMFKRFKWRPAYEFLWRTNGKDELLGPYCSVCKAFVIQLKISYEKQMRGAFQIAQGVKTEYHYQCSNPKCTSKVIALGLDLQTLTHKVQEEYFSEP